MNNRPGGNWTGINHRRIKMEMMLVIERGKGKAFKQIQKILKFEILEKDEIWVDKNGLPQPKGFGKVVELD